MPIEYDVDEDENFIYVKLTGAVTLEEMLTHSDEFWADPRLKAGFRELYDASGGSSSEVGPEVVEVILAEDMKHRPKFPGSKTALLMPDDPAFDMAKKFEKQALSGIVVFFSRDIALTWLGYTGRLSH
jgi:hypothetical protein